MIFIELKKTKIEAFHMYQLVDGGITMKLHYCMMFLLLIISLIPFQAIEGTTNEKHMEIDDFILTHKEPSASFSSS